MGTPNFQADGYGSKKFIRKSKHKVERKRAKKDPDCVPQYNKYNGWQL